MHWPVWIPKSYNATIRLSAGHLCAPLSTQNGFSPSVPTAELQREVAGDYIRQFLSHEEIVINESSPDLILENTTTAKWTSVSVATAFMSPSSALCHQFSHRAAVAHQLTNVLHESFFEDGIKRATELAAYIKEHGRPVGPLHGLPVRLEDSVNVKGIDTTNGFIGRIDAPPKEDAELARILRSLDAIIYCKTAVPQASFAAETENNIIGYTTNAYNRLLSSGGSSGGECPLLALRGSVVGLGSDIGGSIRYPAALNGFFGLKLSYRHLPIEGVDRVMEGQDMVPFSWGPLSSSAAGLTLIVKSILAQEPWISDPRVVEIPWQNYVYEDFVQATKGGRQLVFGVMRNDGIVQPQPPISLGHKVIDWQPPSHEEANKLSMATWLFDGSEDVLKNLALSGEPIVDSVAQISGSKPGKQSTTSEIANTNIAIWRYRKKFMDYWNSTKDLTGTGRPVDAVIAPTYPYAVSVIPVITADKDVDVYPADFSPLILTLDDPEIQHGSPVGISIFGRRFQDEKILGILVALSSA
ncbi:amidase [Zopfia rhizophila CBS 207.26]|uniref:Amidase n=1 Tax=Zopfia rhizophila CBS 207.26 TaxID=1314779 RepID=A0A6A6EFY5_9PEZI|nr:amidase [Zopfia rhizophila CBS 207.26]